MKNKKFLAVFFTAVLLIGLFYAAAKVYKSKEAERVSFMALDQFKLFVPDHAIKKGSASAKVFIVEFFDPECESCREFHPYMHSILSDYEGKVQLVMRYAPFHGNSMFAIKILEAARMQDKYWEALQILFQHQPEWGNHHNPRPELIWEYLPRLGINMDEVKKHMEDPSIQEIIAQDQKDGQQLNVRATPTFFVNGKSVEEFGPDPLRAAIDAALKEL
jgi:protein-disulfide isomerase